jgi:hypothetical protein
MRDLKKLQRKYGYVGGEIASRFPDCQIAGSPVFHIHFRGNIDVDDEVLELCGQILDLTALVLNDTSATDQGLRFLLSLKKLSILHLARTAITDHGLAYLVKLPLSVIDLSGTSISDKGLEVLGSCSTLTEIRVSETNVSEIGADRFHQQFPACRINGVAGGC